MSARGNRYWDWRAYLLGAPRRLPGTGIQQRACRRACGFVGQAPEM